MLGCAGVADGSVVQGIHSPAVPPREQVAIDLQGEGRRVVAELLLDVGQRLPGLQEEAGEGVPEAGGFR